MRVMKFLMAGALLCLADAASAAVVTQWNWDATSQFNTSGTVFGSGSGTTENTATRLSWGETHCQSIPIVCAFQGRGPIDPAQNSDRSGITWNTPFASGSGAGGVVTNGATVNTNVATHYNNDISSSYSTLRTGVINTTLNLYVPPATGPGPATQAFTQNLTFFFVETPNNGGTSGSGNCLIGGPDGNCPDIFVLASGTTTDTFVYDGVTYEIEIDALINGQDAFGPLNSQICAFSQINPLCVAGGPGFVPFGFTTPEGDHTTIQFTLSVTALQQVPEPSALALIGAALLGLTGLRRRTRT